MTHSTRSTMSDEQIDNLIDEYMNLYARSANAMRLGFATQIAAMTGLTLEDVREIWSNRT